MAQKYPKPPIVEAVLQLRFGDKLSDGDLRRIPAILAGEYPKKKEEADLQLEVEVKAGSTSTPPKSVVIDKGVRLLSADDQRVVVVRTTKVVFAYHAPYPGWDTFIESAKDVFGTLRQKIGFRSIKTVGLRYVNRLDIPLAEDNSLIQPSDYITVGIALPDNGISTRMRQFQVLTDIELNHDGSWARVQATTAVGALIDHASILFDIDVIVDRDVPQKDDDLWSLVERMRNDKNAIFESGITENARKLFGLKS